MGEAFNARSQKLERVTLGRRWSGGRPGKGREKAGAPSIADCKRMSRRAVCGRLVAVKVTQTAQLSWAAEAEVRQGNMVGHMAGQVIASACFLRPVPPS